MGCVQWCCGSVADRMYCCTWPDRQVRCGAAETQREAMANDAPTNTNNNNTNNKNATYVRQMPAPTTAMFSNKNNTACTAWLHRGNGAGAAGMHA